MNQCSQPSWSKLNTAAMLHDVFSVTKTHYVHAKGFLAIVAIIIHIHNGVILHMNSFCNAYIIVTFQEILFKCISKRG